MKDMKILDQLPAKEEAMAEFAADHSERDRETNDQRSLLHGRKPWDL